MPRLPVSDPGPDATSPFSRRNHREEEYVMTSPSAPARCRIDLNADVGESFGPWNMGEDARLLPLLSSANIACGWHAGDPAVMERTVSLAVAAGFRGLWEAQHVPLPR
jgi:hypothetical protein